MLVICKFIPICEAASFGPLRLAPYVTAYAILALPNAFIEIPKRTVVGIPVIAIVVAFVVGVGAYYLRSFRSGRELYAVGSNRSAAYLAGVHAGRLVRDRHLVPRQEGSRADCRRSPASVPDHQSYGHRVRRRFASHSDEALRPGDWTHDG